MLTLLLVAIVLLLVGITYELYLTRTNVARMVHAATVDLSRKIDQLIDRKP